MGLLRNRQSGPPPTIFKMREKLISIGDDSWIEDADGNRVFKADGKALRVRDTFILKDASGNEVAKIQEKAIAIRDKMKIDLPGGSATIMKRAIGIRDRFKIDLDNGPDLSAMGNFVDHEYTIEQDGNKVAEISKKWFRVRDTYGVEIEQGANIPLILAITVAIDSMVHG
ncbi:MAG: LURP-one-related family protein [Actinobacteria bacterium]|nr:LURP-one-related family protein [Actinomycetota bacterium]